MLYNFSVRRKKTARMKWKSYTHTHLFGMQSVQKEWFIFSGLFLFVAHLIALICAHVYIFIIFVFNIHKMWIKNFTQLHMRILICNWSIFMGKQCKDDGNCRQQKDEEKCKKIRNVKAHFDDRSTVVCSQFITYFPYPLSQSSHLHHNRLWIVVAKKKFLCVEIIK